MADPVAATVAAALRSRLERWFSEYEDAAVDGVDRGVTGCGQLGRVDRAGSSTVFADDHTDNTDWDLWLEKKA